MEDPAAALMGNDMNDWHVGSDVGGQFQGLEI